jgi:hypothetical protein
VTEEEWLECTDTPGMLAFLRGKASERKLRLFACACCRPIWHLLTDESSRKAVEVAERYVDNLATRNELRSTRKRALRAGKDDLSRHAAAAGASTCSKSAFGAAHNGHLHAIEAEAGMLLRETRPQTRDAFGAYIRARETGFRRTSILLREVVNNPFRPARLDVAVLAWNGGTVVKVAQSIYDDRAFDRLPVLADALEEAGCTDPRILAHLRGTGLHVLGCWALDLLLGKE